jgi:hypothetical protein
MFDINHCTMRSSSPSLLAPDLVRAKAAGADLQRGVMPWPVLVHG